MVYFGGWPSVRDVPKALTGLPINIREANGTIISSAGTGFVDSDPIGLWKRAGPSTSRSAQDQYLRARHSRLRQLRYRGTVVQAGFERLQDQRRLVRPGQWHGQPEAHPRRAAR